MILQSLVRHYEVLLEKGELEKPGWAPAKVSWALELDGNGTPIRLAPLESEETRGKKTVLVPRAMNLPVPVKRAVGILPNFLCDNSSYILGSDSKGKPDRSVKCFEASREWHLRLLQNVDHPAAKAVRLFFENWNPTETSKHPVFKGSYEELCKGGNIVFLYGNRFAQDIPELQTAWDNEYQQEGDAPLARCLVTGQMAPIARLHPNIKGVAGAQSSGASLVSFNAPSFESYEKTQGLNAPVGKQAAFAYTAALNHLLSKKKEGGRYANLIRLSDMSIVFWAESASQEYADAFSGMLGDDEGLQDADVQSILTCLLKGQSVPWKDTELQPDEHFYVLGISPNAARLSVRFFLCDTFGRIMTNICEHQKRLEMIRPAYEKRTSLSAWKLLDETVNQKSRDKQPSPQLSGELIRAILNNSMYPASLYAQIQMRIRAEHAITWGRASAIKAYFIKNLSEQVPSEVREMTLNEETNYQPYLLGRLFAVLEDLQYKANRNVKTTIRDRYFNSACATPSIVFPTLIRLSQAHLKKLLTDHKTDQYSQFEELLTDLLSRMETEYPTRLNLNDQGVFQLGYYHQTQKRFMKEEKENV